MLALVEFERAGTTDRPAWSLDERLAELRELVRSAGAIAVGSVWQRRERPDPALFIGPGKVDELAEQCQALTADLVIFDHDLSPAQVRNLEARLGVGVIDRSQLILDIFAQRAQSREGKLQVELAQLRYLLPRLSGRGIDLSRLGGGIGTRGPGETKLETDRRRVRRRIQELSRELAKIQQHRRIRRRRREDAQQPVIAMVGYTNAGKSTLLRTLAGADTLVEDRLFATLDPKTRRLPLPNGVQALLTDTVGFIRDLPHALVAAFRATLEEVVEADLLLHVVDVSHPNAPETIRVVHQVLAELGAEHKPVVTALNKIDRLEGQPLPAAFAALPHAVPVSALHGQGLDALRQTLARLLAAGRRRLRVEIPYPHLDLLHWIYRHGDVLEAHYAADCVEVLADVSAVAVGQLEERLARLAPPAGR